MNAPVETVSGNRVAASGGKSAPIVLTEDEKKALAELERFETFFLSF